MDNKDLFVKKVKPYVKFLSLRTLAKIIINFNINKSELKFIPIFGNSNTEALIVDIAIDNGVVIININVSNIQTFGEWHEYILSKQIIDDKFASFLNRMTSELIKHYILLNENNNYNYSINSYYYNYSIVNFESTLRKALSEYKITIKYRRNPVKIAIYSKLGSTSITDNSLFINGTYNTHREMIEIIYKPNNYSIQNIQKLHQAILQTKIVEKYSNIYMIIIKCIDTRKQNISLPFILGSRTINNIYIINYYNDKHFSQFCHKLVVT